MKCISIFCWLTGFITFPKQNILYAFYVCQQFIQNIFFILNYLKSICIIVKMKNENNYFRLILFHRFKYKFDYYSEIFFKGQ
jgi:hypothetical protein